VLRRVEGLLERHTVVRSRYVGGHYREWQIIVDVVISHTLYCGASTYGSPSALSVRLSTKKDVRPQLTRADQLAVTRQYGRQRTPPVISRTETCSPLGHPLEG
jgi:hypothetical protein